MYRMLYDWCSCVHSLLYSMTFASVQRFIYWTFHFPVYLLIYPFLDVSIYSHICFCILLNWCIYTTFVFMYLPPFTISFILVHLKWYWFILWAIYSFVILAVDVSAFVSARLKDRSLLEAGSTCSYAPVLLKWHGSHVSSCAGVKLTSVWEWAQLYEKSCEPTRGNDSLPVCLCALHVSPFCNRSPL